MIFYKTQIDTLPCLELCGKEHLTPPTMHRSRYADSYILYFVISGRLCLTDNGRDIELLPGDAYLFNKGEYHSPRYSYECEYYFIHFDMPFTETETEDHNKLLFDKHNAFLTSMITSKDYDTEMYFPKYIHVHKKSARNDIIKLFENTRLKIGTDKSEYFKSISALRLVEILVKLYRIFASQELNVHDEEGKNLIQNIIRYLENNLEKNITSSDLEENFGYNFDYLNRKFKYATQKTIFSYLKEVRITNATRLLKRGTIPISDIANRCGFCDVYYFSRVYKKETGFPPSKIKRQDF